MDIIQKFKSIFTCQRVAWVIVGYGVLCRFSEYLLNRSLWLDELKCALKVNTFTFYELLRPELHASAATAIKYQQAPYGVFALTKVLVQFLGNNEYVLRLFPFVCSLLALVLFYKFACLFLDKKTSLIALTLFSAAPMLMYYASDFHPYSSDVFFTILIFFIFHYIQTKELNIKTISLLGLSGAVSIWFCYTNVLVMVALGSCLLLFSIMDKDFRKVFKMLGIFIIWLASFVVNYVSYIYYFMKPDYIQEAWGSGYMPLYPFSDTLIWLYVTFYDFLSRSPFVFNHPPFIFIILMLGFAYFMRGEKRKGIYIASPILMTLLASAFHIYPFKGRVVLFLVPVVCLFIARGISRINFVKKPAWHLASLLSLIAVLYSPLYNTAKLILHPVFIEELRPVLKDVSELKQDGDVFYIYTGAGWGFEFYKAKFGLEKEKVIFGISARHDRSKIDADLNQLIGHKRVWIIVSHIYIDEDIYILSHLEKIGKQKGLIQTAGAGAALYDLSDGPFH